MPETLVLTLPVALWRHRSTSEGIRRVTGTGFPGTTTSRRSELIVVPIRCTETEWPDVRRLIEWGQTKAPFLWYPESDPLAEDQLVNAVVTMVAPRVADPITPEPDPGYPRVLVINLTFRQIQAGGS